MKTIVRLANYLTRIYFATPVPFRWFYWAIPVIYFIFPPDFIPDMIPGLGRLDDLILVLFGFWVLERAGRFKDFFKEAKRGASAGEAAGTETNLAPHEVLGVRVDAAPDEIKKAYRKLLNMYHPDKFAHLGDEFEQTARRRTQTIIAAYERIKKGVRT